ncbi:MAG TPA: type VI secretion system tip protein TssI/VgrG [Thermohalobaculum sp.]|nr:type VI secretion system tip protein TssI/VgrG [Thermohalobaculum sp.]
MLDERAIKAETSLGESLMFAHMRGTDYISRPYAYVTTLLSEDPDLDPLDILGTPALINLEGHTGERYFSGRVGRFELASLRDGFAHYRAELRPWLWFLGFRYDCRIFQNKTAVEIIEKVFGDYPEARYELRLQGSYPTREYCVQYDESDLDFVSRLMEHEGIFYFFEHAEDGHTLVLGDHPNAYGKAEGYETVPFWDPAGVAPRPRDHINRWVPRSEVRSATYTHTDYDFEKPRADLMAKSEQALGHKLDAGEQYRDPGAHLEVERGERLAAIRREELQAAHRLAEAEGDARGLSAGYGFVLEGFAREDQNVRHLVVRAEHELWDPTYRTSTQHEGPPYTVRMEARPAEIAFRPERLTPRPVIRGPQTATVVGPAGEEIHCDKYARVKVQFHWDRLGEDNENSSCFVRVSQTWAGANWGFIQIPRIGQEVIVGFLEGDPDQPIITGRVYNADQMPPYELPGKATQSGWKSDSSPGGGGFNELRFEDRKGGEEVYFQAEKDNTILVKNDRNETVQHDENVRIDNNATHSVGVNLDEDVGNNKTTQVGNNRSVTIGTDDTLRVGRNRSHTIGVNETIAVGANQMQTIGANQTETVGANQTVTVGAARIDTVRAAESRTVGAAQTMQIGATRNVTVGGAQSHAIGQTDSWTVAADRSASIGANDSTDVAADQSLTVGAARTVSVGTNLSVTAGDQISITCGSSSLVMKKDGTIFLKGKDITIDGSGQISIKADADVVIKGKKILQN